MTFRGSHKAMFFTGYFASSALGLLGYGLGTAADHPAWVGLFLWCAAVVCVIVASLLGRHAKRQLKREHEAVSELAIAELKRRIPAMITQALRESEQRRFN